MSMAPALLLVVATAILAAPGAAEDGPAAAPTRTAALLAAGDEPVRVVCFGDSITGAYYHTGSMRAYCDMLGFALRRLYPDAQLEMINAGISGNTTANGLARIERDVLSRHPHLVTVMFGINDMNSSPAEAYRENLQELVDRCEAGGAEVLLCTPTFTTGLGSRPMSLQEAYAEAVSQVARASGCVVADCHHAFRRLHEEAPETHELMMSDAVHPNMNGHKLIAEVIAEAISGREVSVADVPPPALQMRQSLTRKLHTLPLRAVAMPPYDELLKQALDTLPGRATTLEVTTWPVEESVSAMEQWAKANIRTLRPDLVVVAVPADATGPDRSSYIASYEWILNWSLDFGPGTWDCVPVLPSVTDPDLTAEERQWEDLARRLIAGKDLRPVERQPGDDAPALEILTRFIQRQYEQWSLTGAAAANVEE
ncbi:MAG: SGNH/GDSL hydrolase family protein [Armatimonadota bacterium]